VTPTARHPAARPSAGILTVAVITYPFGFEGRRRANQAVDGTEKLRQVGLSVSARL